MSKTWQERLRQTMRKVRDTEGDEVADTLQRILDGLSETTRQQISGDLSLGWRIWWNRGAAETRRRAAARANALERILEDRLGTLGIGVQRAVTRIDYVGSIQELELRLLEPSSFFLSFIGSDVENATTQSQYTWALTHRWANSCGGFSAALKRIASDDWETLVDTNSDATVRSRNWVGNQFASAIENTDNRYLRVNLGCHSFMIENLGSDCRIYQVYMGMGYGGYNFVEDLNHQVVLPRENFVELLKEVIDDEDAANEDDGAAIQLFKGSCYPSLNTVGGQEVCARIERTRNPRSVSDMAAEAQQMCDERDGSWTAALQNQTVQQFNASVL